MSEVSVEQRLAALEEKVADLTLCIEDHNENIRAFSERINEYGARAEKNTREAYEEAVVETREACQRATQVIEDGIKVLEEACGKARNELTKGLTEEVVAELGSGTHGLVRVAGQAHPVFKKLS
jgi:gas vesicle protein